MESKVYGISKRRELEIQGKDVVIRDTKSNKIVKIPSSIWFMLSRKFPKIVKALDNAKSSNYFAHLDNGWSVSVRKPHAYVSIRRYYFAPNGGLSPSRQGMSFTSTEWTALTAIFDESSH
jgi:hypothetical protein